MAFVILAAFAFQLGAPVGAADRPAVTALVARARNARLQQDSALAGYETIARQRVSSHIGLANRVGAAAANRLAARFESVARVGWSHDRGAWGEVIAARAVAPIVGAVDPGSEEDDFALVLPYYPGRDRLWPLSEMRNALPHTIDWIDHPLSAGADSLYEFSIGDSLRITLPDATSIRLREIRVRPRRPAARLIVGSLWVDVATGNLVRAAYRPSVPIDLWPFMEKELKRTDHDKVKKLGPFTGVIREIIVDHGLYQGRFWLPKTRLATAEGTSAAGRGTIQIEQTFQYSNVAALPAGAVSAFADTVRDIDPRDGRVRRPMWRGVEKRTPRCRERGDTSSTRWSSDSLLADERLSIMWSEGVRMRVLLPCSRDDKIDSPALPGSIYSAGEALFSDTDFAALRKDSEEALSMSRQAKWSPQPIALFYGIDRGMLRYNRIEGLSAGLLAERVLGDGYTVGALTRLGVADRQPLAEGYVRRGNVTNELQVTAYRRLAASNDWGNPLGLGASISAAAFGRDDGFYYRASGAELTGVRRSAGEALVMSWRIFAERQTSAHVSTTWSVARSIGGKEFTPNIVASEGGALGMAAAVGYSWGMDPRGLRIFGNTRLETATGVASYGRAMTELTFARGLGGTAQAIVTGAAGISVGSLPAQRWWYLGGPYTVHAHDAGAASGDAFWLGRLELTRGNPILRPIVFGDIGWAGPRGRFVDADATISSAGVGASMIDGLLRFDVSTKLRGAQRLRADVYFEIR